MPAQTDQPRVRRRWAMDQRLTLRLPSRVMDDLQALSDATEAPLTAVARRLLVEGAAAAVADREVA